MIRKALLVEHGEQIAAFQNARRDLIHAVLRMLENRVVAEITGLVHALSVRDEIWRANDRLSTRKPLDEFGRQVDAAFRAAA
jgi:hypothetical protein